MWCGVPVLIKLRIRRIIFVTDVITRMYMYNICVHLLTVVRTVVDCTRSIPHGIPYAHEQV